MPEVEITTTYRAEEPVGGTYRNVYRYVIPEDCAVFSAILDELDDADGVVGATLSEDGCVLEVYYSANFLTKDLQSVKDTLTEHISERRVGDTVVRIVEEEKYR